MLPKPAACEGCPLYQDGKGFVPDELVEGATVFVLGQNPGADEEREGVPFVGKTGESMQREFFPEAGLVRGENVSCGNAIRCRLLKDGKRTNSLPPKKILDAAVAHCTAAHMQVPESTKLIVATGALPWKACGNETQITDWRGFVSPHPMRRSDGQLIPVMGVLHVADLFRDPKMRIPSHRDWRKVPLFLEGKWPLPMPERLEVSWETWPQVEGWFTDAAKAPFVAIDTEFDRDTHELFLIGMGFPGGPVLQVRWKAIGGDLRAYVTEALRALISKVTVVFQNTPADEPVLRQNLGIELKDFVRIEDTMLAHSVLWSEWPHKLEFLASVYGEHAKMKHLSKVDPMLYNAGDVVDTISSWQGMETEFKRDPQSWTIYRTQPIELLPVVIRARERGIRVNKARVGPAEAEYATKLEQAGELARAYAGWPLNIGSDDQLKVILYDCEGLPLQLHKKTKRPSVDADSVAELRKLYDPLPDYEREEREGLTWDEVLARVDEGAHPLLESRAFYMGAQQARSHYILPCYVDKDPTKGLVDRLYPEFHIHAQANARWSTVNPPLAQLPEDLRDIIMPDEGTTWMKWDWSQIELRINAANCGDLPSLEAFDNDWDIHSMNAMDIFWGRTEAARLSYAQELLGLSSSVPGPAVSSGDRTLLLECVSQFKAGMDGALARSGLVPADQDRWRTRLRASSGSESWPGRGRTPQEWESAQQLTGQLGGDDARRARTVAYAAWVVCGGPPIEWDGKADARRVFAKRFVYRLDYGGDPARAGEIPGAKALGLDSRALVQASNRYLAAHPAKAAWRMEVRRRISRPPGGGVPFSETFLGRKRRILVSGPAAWRIAFDHPMQAGVSDIANLTAVRIYKELPHLEFVYQMHDGWTYQCPSERVKETWPVLKEIVESEWNVNGAKVRFPASYQERSAA